MTPESRHASSERASERCRSTPWPSPERLGGRLRTPARHTAPSSSLGLALPGVLHHARLCGESCEANWVQIPPHVQEHFPGVRRGDMQDVGAACHVHARRRTSEGCSAQQQCLLKMTRARRGGGVEPCPKKGHAHLRARARGAGRGLAAKSNSAGSRAVDAGHLSGTSVFSDMFCSVHAKHTSTCTCI